MSKKIDLEIKVPTSWSAVPLRKYLTLMADMETYKDTEEAVEAAMFYHLCDVPPNYLTKLDISIYTNIRKELYNLINISDAPLQRIITINGKRYGFEPNLAEMEYGAYLDLMKYKEVNIDENWAEIMSILYRPVKNTIGKLYEIETYSGKIDKELFMDVTMDVHFGAMFFFLNTLMDLLKDIQSSMKEELQKKVPNLDTTLIKNGVGIHRFINLPKVIS
jgi:hypothetical protein